MGVLSFFQPSATNVIAFSSPSVTSTNLLMEEARAACQGRAGSPEHCPRSTRQAGDTLPPHAAGKPAPTRGSRAHGSRARQTGLSGRVCGGGCAGEALEEDSTGKTSGRAAEVSLWQGIHGPRYAGVWASLQRWQTILQTRKWASLAWIRNQTQKHADTKKARGTH